jgi:pantoate ligase / CMP/dCMP kinase
MTAVLHSIAAWKKAAALLHPNDVVGFVPTMGALHDGHGALLEQARQRCSVVVASVFVNPIQFDQKSDFERYPRPLDDDVAFCAAQGVDYIFAPSASEMSPQPQRASGAPHPTGPGNQNRIFRSCEHRDPSTRPVCRVARACRGGGVDRRHPADR